MMGALNRKGVGLGIGLLAYFVVRKPSRRERRRALREAIYRGYDLAGDDPAFMAEHLKLTKALDATSSDGLREA